MKPGKSLSRRPAHAAAVPAADAYTLFLGELKRRIASAQTRAHLAVSRELTLLYWADRPGHRPAPETGGLGKICH